jgi:hypothetical protein
VITTHTVIRTDEVRGGDKIYHFEWGYAPVRETYRDSDGRIVVVTADGDIVRSADTLSTVIRYV